MSMNILILHIIDLFNLIIGFHFFNSSSIILIVTFSSLTSTTTFYVFPPINSKHNLKIQKKQKYKLYFT